MAKKKVEPKTKSKRPGVAGKGNPAPVNQVVKVEDKSGGMATPPAVEAQIDSPDLKALAAGLAQEPPPFKPPKSKSELKRRKKQGDKSVAQLQAETFNPADVRAAFTDSPTEMLKNAGLRLPMLSTPVLEVADAVLSRLFEFQESLGDKPLAGKAPSWLEHLDIIGDGFEDQAVKLQAWGKVSGLTKKQGDKDPLKSLKDSLLMAMELAGAVGKDDPGLAVGPVRAKHMTGENVTIDTEGVMTYLLERGVNAQLLDDARKANTTTTPFAYVKFLRMVDQRGMNLAAHQEDGDDSTEDDR